MRDQASLLFIPDVSGFTQFVHQTEVGWVRQSSRYYLLDGEGEGTRVRLEVHYRHWPLLGWLIEPSYRKETALDVQHHLHLLKTYCERLIHAPAAALS